MSEAGDPSGSNTGVSATLSSLPEFQVLLPDSLSVSNRESEISRNAGDISTITSENLDAVKSQGWYDMKDNIGMDTTTKMFLEMLRDYAKDHEITMGEAFSMGVQTVSTSEGSLDMGKIIVDGNSDEDFVVYWYIPYPASLMNPEETGIIPYYIFMDVDKTSGTYEVSMDVYFTIPASLTPFLSEDLELYMTTSFNEDTGESLMAQNSLFYNVVKKSVPNSSDDSYTIMIKEFDQTGIINGMTIGWGDNTKGGLASRWNENYIDVEFYNGQGHLIKKSHGSKSRYTSWLDYYTDDTEYYINLSPNHSSAPDQVFLRWNTEDSQYEYSLDNSNFTALSGISSVNTFYFKADSEWSYGDCIYTVVSRNSDTGIRTYAKNYVVPEQETFMGESYFMDNQYPLKNLLPLHGDYSDFNLLAKEGNTYSEVWTYYENEEEIEENWSWTDYDYFIDINNNQLLDYSDDIVINGISFQDVYIWDNNSGDYTIESGAFYLLTETQTLPAYLHFSEENQDSVDLIGAKLTEIYNSSEFSDFALDEVNFTNPYEAYQEIFEALIAEE